MAKNKAIRSMLRAVKEAPKPVVEETVEPVILTGKEKEFIKKNSYFFRKLYCVGTARFHSPLGTKGMSLYIKGEHGNDYMVENVPEGVLAAVLLAATVESGNATSTWHADVDKMVIYKALYH